MQVKNIRTEQSLRGAEMADAPYRCQPFPAPLHSRNHCVLEECCCVVFLIIVAMHIPIMTQGNLNPVLLTSDLRCEAREAGSFLASIAHSHAVDHKKLAFIASGEMVAHLKGKGLGGRNQELAMAAAEGIAGLPNVAIFSVGSDGTDGPTDAAGGYVDGST